MHIVLLKGGACFFFVYVCAQHRILIKTCACSTNTVSVQWTNMRRKSSITCWHAAVLIHMPKTFARATCPQRKHVISQCSRHFRQFWGHWLCTNELFYVGQDIASISMQFMYFVGSWATQQHSIVVKTQLRPETWRKKHSIRCRVDWQLGECNSVQSPNYSIFDSEPRRQFLNNQSLWHYFGINTTVIAFVCIVWLT